ncbi:MAG: hypothetical protein F6J90_32430 [Moorea sp. SIOASIH]|uniref:hypothetical protein n=1 Tax=Moorena sp. SIOASIH TaxID=2607817 RepID=UPI0013BCEA5B|nr:hypothetical protein [Moorena sp. SIOASIH]NEO40790.1 hypothetical protein [Moorena sp. SIOASIH]
MDTRCGRAITLNLLTLAKRPRDRVQPSTLAKRPRDRVQSANLGQKATRSRSTFNLQPSTFNLQPWPKGHAIAFNLQPSTFNLGQKATRSRSTFIKH